MKTILITALLVVFLYPGTFAQNKTTSLNVFIQFAKPDSITNATLQLYLLPDSIFVASRIDNKKANSFIVSPFSKYIIKATAIGFETGSKTINIIDKPVVSSLQLKRFTGTMQNVVIVSRKPLIKQEDDKTIVDATVLANSSSSAYEVLEKTPGAIVDQDGNVYLSSISPATVFINGREMKLSSEDLASLLKSLPANSVSKIELLRNPSAKYDAASSGGIVNIVLKKGVKLGSSGSVNLGYFQGVYSTKNAGINLNRGTGKMNSYFTYQYTNKKNFGEITTRRQIKTDSSLLAQNAYSTYPSVTNYLGTGVDYAFTKKFNIAYDIRLNNTSGKSNTLNNTDISKPATNILLSKSQTDIANRNTSFFITNSLSAKYKIDSAGSEWTMEFDYNYYRNKNTQVYSSRFYLPARPSILGDGENNNTKNIYTAQSDLILKLPHKITLESGLKAAVSKSNNRATYFYDTANNGRRIDPFQTNTFTYKETIGAAYLQLAKTFYGFTLKPGVRFETTNINGRQLIPKDTTLSIKRTDAFPYVFLRHNLFKLMGMQLVGNAIYRRSIKRPYYEILNPYPRYVDQYLFDVGNPKLQPQFNTNYEFNIMFDDFPVFAFGANETKDIFSNVTYQDDITKIAYRTFDNLGKNKEFYFRVVGGIPPGGKYFFYVGAQHSKTHYTGLYQNQPLDFKNSSWHYFMYQELKLGKTLTLDMEGFLLSNFIQNFYVLDNIGALYFSANKSILKKKANLIFSINDVFNSNRPTINLNQGNVSVKGTRASDSRRAGITFRYNFGLSKPKENQEFGVPGENKVN